MAALEQKSARYDFSSRPIVHTIGMFFLATALLYGLYVLQMNVSEVLSIAACSMYFMSRLKNLLKKIPTFNEALPLQSGCRK